jgi:hypothetical protein
MTTPAWDYDSTIEVMAPTHTVRCLNCFGPIKPGEVFNVRDGRPAHIECPQEWTPMLIVGDGERDAQLTFDLSGPALRAVP